MWGCVLRLKGCVGFGGVGDSRVAPLAIHCDGADAGVFYFPPAALTSTLSLLSLSFLSTLFLFSSGWLLVALVGLFLVALVGCHLLLPIGSAL
jgi:hypothetical protein